jgi:hypothetical protein
LTWVRDTYVWMFTKMENNPIEIDSENKIKIKPELMVEEKLYPFIHENSVFLFFKDENELIHCYEILDKEIKDKLLNNPDKIVEILEEVNH